MKFPLQLYLISDELVETEQNNLSAKELSLPLQILVTHASGMQIQRSFHCISATKWLANNS